MWDCQGLRAGPTVTEPSTLKCINPETGLAPGSPSGRRPRARSPELRPLRESVSAAVCCHMNARSIRGTASAGRLSASAHSRTYSSITFGVIALTAVSNYARCRRRTTCCTAARTTYGLCRTECLVRSALTPSIRRSAIIKVSAGPITLHRDSCRSFSTRRVGQLVARC